MSNLYDDEYETLARRARGIDPRVFVYVERQEPVTEPVEAVETTETTETKAPRLRLVASKR
jgi:hypothetical protein